MSYKKKREKSNKKTLQISFLFSSWVLGCLLAACLLLLLYQIGILFYRAQFTDREWINFNICEERERERESRWWWCFELGGWRRISCVDNAKKQQHEDWKTVSLFFFLCYSLTIWANLCIPISSSSL